MFGILVGSPNVTALLKETAVPGQVLLSEGVTLTVNAFPTVTVEVAVFVQPFASVAVTV